MYSSILVPVDLNDAGSWKGSLPVSVKLAQTFGAKLHVTTVVPDFGVSMVGQYFPPGYEIKVREEHERQLKDLVKNEVPAGIDVAHSVLEGKIYQEILHAIAALKVDLVVMHSHRPELQDFLLGPNAARVVRHASCSVMVVRE